MNVFTCADAILPGFCCADIFSAFSASSNALDTSIKASYNRHIIWKIH